MEEREMTDIVTPSEEIASNESTSVAAPKEAVAEEKKEKPMTKKRKVLNAIFLGFQIALVVLSIVICLVVILNPNSQDEVSPVGVKLLPVLTGSMDGDKKDSFPAGSLVIATSPKNGGEGLEVGKIVTFKQRNEITNEMMLVTHRIVEVVKVEEGVFKYKTQGDANNKPDEALKLPGDIMAVYSFHIKGLGKALTWIRDGYHFIFVIIIPLGVLLIYNIYLVAQIVVENKMKKARAAAAETAKAAALASIDEEEIKRRAIEEYLRSQGNGQNEPEPPEEPDDPEDPKGHND